MSSQRPQDINVFCPECAAALTATSTQCWLCGRKVGGAEMEAATPIERAVRSIDHPPPQFGLASLILTVTLISVCLGVFVLQPGLGILLAIVMVPAFARTGAMVARRKARGRRMVAAEKIGAFFASLFVVILVGLAACITFAAVCFPIGLGVVERWGDLEVAIVVGLVFAGIAALVVAGLLLRLLWPRKD